MTVERSHLAQPTQPDEGSLRFWCGRSAEVADLFERTPRSARRPLCQDCVSARTFAAG